MKFLSLLLCLISFQAFSQKVEMSEFENDQVTFTGSGFFKSDESRTYQVNFYVNNEFAKQVLTNSNGSFSYTTKKELVDWGDTIKVQVNQWHSNSKHWTEEFKIQKIGEPIYPRIVEVSEYKNGQVTIVGSGFIKTGPARKYQVNFYVNKEFKKQILTNENGSFSYTTAKGVVERGDTIKVQVNQWHNENDHWTKSFEIPRGRPLYPRVVTMGKFENDQVTVVGKGFVREGESRTYTVIIELEGRKLDKIKTNKNGSFSYTTRRGKVETDDLLEVIVVDWHVDGRNWEKKFYIPESEEVKREREILRKKIPAYAVQQANTLMNRVVPEFAEVISWKRSFARMFISQFEMSSDKYDAGRSEYKIGEREGRAEGEDRGTINGKNQGQSQADSLAKERVRKAYRAAVDDPDELSLKSLNDNVPNKSFSGDREPEVPGDLSGVSYDLNRSLNREHKDFNSRYFGQRLLGELKIENVSQYQYVTSNARNVLSAEDAYQAWLNRKFNGSYDYNLWRHPLIDNEMKREFKRIFKDRYNLSIDQKVEQFADNNHYTAKKLGRKYGQLLGEAKVHEEGRVDGFNRAYGPAADSGFMSVFAPRFKQVFASNVDYYENNAVLLNISTELVEENNNRLWEAGELLGLRVKSMINMGRKSIDLNISIPSNSAVQSVNTKNYSMAGLSSLKAKKLVFDELAQIKSNLAEEKTYKVKALVGNNYANNLSFYYGWKKVITNLKATIYDANKDGVWEKGESIGVKINSGKNSSLADAKFEVQLSGNSVQVLKRNKDLVLAADSSITSPVYFSDMVKIPNNISEDQQHSLSLKIGAFTYSFNFVVGWTNIINVYATKPNHKIKEQILSHIKREWSEITAKRQRKNWYKHGRNGQKTYLESLVETAKKNGINNYRSLGDASICKMIGKRYWISNPWKYNFGKSFKKLWKNIDPKCK